MNNLLQNWNLMRALRLVLGGIILVQGIQAQEYMYALAGVFLSGMALANIGCCGVGGCAVPPKKVTTIESTKDIDYEEVV
ncbi:MAG: hypothetical protein NTY72_09640 [Bacteroidetes bacterium]|nr:hypothetical protein [Bacteroidota bacterium]